MTAYLCPIFQEPQFTDNDEFLAGGLLWFYEAGTSVLATAYTTDVGDVAWSNPIVLDSRGETGGTIWLAQGVAYRIVLEGKPAYGQTHGTVITEHDNITGINDVTFTLSQSDWLTFAGSPNYVSTTSFSVAGDYRSIFVENRKLRLTDTGGVSTHSVTSSTYLAGVTTVNITGNIDNGISLVEYSLVTPDASPDRFTNITVTNSVDVTNDVTIGDDLSVTGDVSITGTLNSTAMADYWIASNNPASLAASGYQKFKSGLIIQWGEADIPVGGNVQVTFPTAFTTAVYSITATAMTASRIISTDLINTTDFYAVSRDAGGLAAASLAKWMAIGK